MTLAEQINAEAHYRAAIHFGPTVTPEQIARVVRCEWDIFIYHAATGGDADCWCGAHVSELRPPADNAS